MNSFSLPKSRKPVAQSCQDVTTTNRYVEKLLTMQTEIKLGDMNLVRDTMYLF